MSSLLAPTIAGSRWELRAGALWKILWNPSLWHNALGKLHPPIRVAAD